MRLAVIGNVLVFGAVASLALSQGPPASTHGPEFQERRLAVDLIRAVNTAEMAYRSHSGGLFAGWASISTTPEFTSLTSRLSRGEPELKEINLSSPEEILPGWRLRFTLSDDRKSYTVVVINTADRCLHALMSDQDGIIWEGQSIGCPESK